MTHRKPRVGDKVIIVRTNWKHRAGGVGKITKMSEETGHSGIVQVTVSGESWWYPATDGAIRIYPSCDYDNEEELNG